MADDDEMEVELIRGEIRIQNTTATVEDARDEGTRYMKEPFGAGYMLSLIQMHTCTHSDSTVLSPTIAYQLTSINHISDL